MTFDKEQLDTLCRIAEAAGREIMDVYRHGGESWQKDDASPLTEADLRADRVIRAGLEATFPGVFILSEESSSAGSDTGRRFFLVDPLDGTKEFLKRNDEFTVNIAFVEDQQVTAAVVLAPALGDLYFAARGLGAWKRRGGDIRPLSVKKHDVHRAVRVIGSRSHGGDALSAWLAGLPVTTELVVAGSSLKFCRLADGDADLYPRFGPTSQWDTAAAQCVLEVAGGSVVDRATVRPLTYGLHRPILNPEFVATGDPSLLTLLRA